WHRWQQRCDRTGPEQRRQRLTTLRGRTRWGPTGPHRRVRARVGTVPAVRRACAEPRRRRLRRIPSSPMTAPGPTQQDLPLDGKAALVTGGGSGIGLETARVLLADGATVTICGRTEERLREAAEEVNGDGSGRPDLRSCVADARDEAAVEAAVAAASEPLGGLHLAVASAGRGGLGPIIATPLEEWEDILATNLTGTFLIFTHAGAAIARSGGGWMVAISSIAAAVTHPFMGPYCVSKAGIDML